MINVRKLRESYFNKGYDVIKTAQLCRNKVYQNIRPVIVKLGLDKLSRHISLKSYRHSYGIVRANTRGISIYQVMGEMGHTQLETTQRYLKINLRRIKEQFPELEARKEN